MAGGTFFYFDALNFYYGSADIDMEIVTHHLTPDASVTLQIVATSPAFATPPRRRAFPVMAGLSG